jgi:hypothetical protein
MGPRFLLTYDKILELRRFLPGDSARNFVGGRRASAASEARTRMPRVDLLNGHNDCVHREREIAPKEPGLSFVGYQRLTAASR